MTSRWSVAGSWMALPVVAVAAGAVPELVGRGPLPDWIPVVLAALVGTVALPLVVFAVVRLGAVNLYVAVVVAAILVIEELHASARNAVEGAQEAPELFAVGHQMHEPAVVTLTPIALLVLALVPLLVLGRRIRAAPALLWPIAAFGAATVLTNVLIGADALGYVRALTTPLLVLSGVLAGAITATASASVVRHFVITVLALKTAMALAVAVGLLVPRGPRFVVFYDSVTPAFAGAAILAVVMRRDRDRLDFVIGALGVLLLVLSPRRTPLLAVVIALFAAAVAGGRVYIARRVGVLAGVGLLVVVFQSALPTALSTRVATNIASITDTGPDASSREHFQDLFYGLSYAVQNSSVGGGSDIPQLPGLAADGARQLYVHDEFLQMWIRYGVLGALVLVALLVTGVLLALRQIRRGEQSLLVLVGCAVCVMAPTVLVFFPYLSTTTRWPVFFGVALGVVGSAARSGDTARAPFTGDFLGRHDGAPAGRDAAPVPAAPARV